MKKLLSVIVATLFAATAFNAVAQKDVTTKDAAPCRGQARPATSRRRR